MATRVSSPVLIGRLDEQDRLAAALRRAEDGESNALLIAGEAGVGKTRLVEDFADGARSRGATVLIGGCIDMGDGVVPYAPVVEALRGFVRAASPEEIDDVFGVNRTELARLVPDLGPAITESETRLIVQSAQGRLFELVLGALDRLSARAAVVFVVEDLHWSDRSTRDLLAFLIRNLRDAPITLLLTYRSDELHRRHPLLPFLAELERTGRVERIALEPLTANEVGEQLRAIAGHDLAATLLDSIASRSGGNAFFAEELFAACGEDGSVDLSQTLREVLLAHVAGLTEPTQDFLRIASAAGRRVDPTLVADAAALDEPRLFDALRECVARQILVPVATSEGERYAFRHALLQEAVYDDLLPGERTKLHSAFARSLEARASPGARHTAELAYHWYAAHDLPRALGAAVAAATEAEARYAFPEAQSQYERAIELWDQVPDAEARVGEDRIEVLSRLAGVARFHDPTRAIATIREAIGLIDRDADRTRAALLNERLGRYAWIAGEGELAQRAYQAAVDDIPADPPSAAAARALAGLAQILMLGARFEESRRVAERALKMARLIGARDVEGHALNTRAMDRGIAGEVEPALVDLHVALEIASELALVDDVGRAYANRQWVLDSANRLNEALAVADEGVVVTERLGLMRFFGAHLLCYAADALFRLGRWDESESAIRRALESSPVAVNEILEQELRARLALARGRFEEARTILAPLAPLADRAADIQFIVPVRASLIQLALWEGRAEDAATIATVAIQQAAYSPEVRVAELDVLGIRAHADLAELARVRRLNGREADPVATGERLLDALRLRHADVLATRPVFAPVSDAWRLLGEAEATRLRGEPDPAAWAASADAWDRVSRPYLAAYARWREAEAGLAAHGDREAVAEALRLALVTARRLGAEPLSRELAALGARARIAIDTPERPAPAESAADPGGGATQQPAAFGLTPREREVLALVALGRTNRQIAGELFISENTAGVHVSRILGKLDVAGRGEAAAIAYRLGMVEPIREPAPLREPT